MAHIADLGRYSATRYLENGYRLPARLEQNNYVRKTDYQLTKIPGTLVSQIQAAEFLYQWEMAEFEAGLRARKPRKMTKAGISALEKRALGKCAACLRNPG